MKPPTLSKFDIKVCTLILNVIIKNYLDRSIGSGTSHIVQKEALVFWIFETSNSQQIYYLGFNTNSKCDYKKLS